VVKERGEKEGQKTVGEDSFLWERKGEVLGFRGKGKKGNLRRSRLPKKRQGL